MDKEEYREGCLVKIDIENKSYVNQEFLTIDTLGLPDNHAAVYETIDITSYPSCGDFKGKKTIVKHGDHATVLRKIGRPFKISLSMRLQMYDVYEILLETSEIRQIFKHNIINK